MLMHEKLMFKKAILKKSPQKIKKAEQHINYLKN